MKPEKNGKSVQKDTYFFFCACVCVFKTKCKYSIYFPTAIRLNDTFFL